MCGRGCTLERGNPRVSAYPGVSPLPLHNVLGDTTACIMGFFFFLCVRGGGGGCVYSTCHGLCFACGVLQKK